MVTLLIDHGANIHNSVKGNTPLQLAAACNAKDVMLCLEHRGGILKQEYGNPLVNSVTIFDQEARLE
jgi:ankyrin repeat protein